MYVSLILESCTKNHNKTIKNLIKASLIRIAQGRHNSSSSSGNNNNNNNNKIIIIIKLIHIAKVYPKTSQALNNITFVNCT